MLALALACACSRDRAPGAAPPSCLSDPAAFEAAAREAVTRIETLESAHPRETIIVKTPLGLPE